MAAPEDPDPYPPYADPTYTMPPTITVQTTLEDGSKSKFIVSIEKLPPAHSKAYLGGYRHTKSGVRYHHGSTQTEREKKVHKNIENLRNRESQTVTMVSKSVQNRREYGTQMKRRDIHLDTTGDVVRAPLPYYSSAQLLEKQRHNGLKIQCVWRGYVARREAWGRREGIYEAEVRRREGEEEKVRRGRERQKTEIERRMNPKSVGDFEILYNELETWRLGEHKKIRGADVTEAERKGMVADLLAKETKLLQTIDNLKHKAITKGKEKKVKKMMDSMSAPKKWEGSNGVGIDVNTPFTTRAKELKELYEGMTDNANLGGVEERLDVLLNVKWTVNEFDCALCRDIVDLIDREADLLNRGRGGGTLGGLRKRLSNLFLQFIETPEFNPESKRFLKVPNGYSVEPLVKTLAAPSNWVE